MVMHWLHYKQSPDKATAHPQLTTICHKRKQRGEPVLVKRDLPNCEQQAMTRQGGVSNDDYERPLPKTLSRYCAPRPRSKPDDTPVTYSIRPSSSRPWSSFVLVLLLAIWLLLLLLYVHGDLPVMFSLGSSLHIIASTDNGWVTQKILHNFCFRPTVIFCKQHTEIKFTSRCRHPSE